MRPQPAHRRQEPHQPRPPPDPGQDRRGRRRAQQDPGGEEMLNPPSLPLSPQTLQTHRPHHAGFTPTHSHTHLSLTRPGQPPLSLPQQIGRHTVNFESQLSEAGRRLHSSQSDDAAAAAVLFEEHNVTLSYRSRCLTLLF